MTPTADLVRDIKDKTGAKKVELTEMFVYEET
jgi:hypothetical protein